ncbi:hypothetical protein [Alteromonas gilva]|uniref:Uncharacterized protein n=1 Tax=Alteromonas gilva TaxID=2987522 RepID=A0ABT5L7P7_9ALTE|nr:hypothetical protein [Alteromonas gilva]MDC8833054.1 hypothetical protein [Alteromonas gilva]
MRGNHYWAGINGLFSLFFVFLIFGGMADIPMQGSDGLFTDSIPQGLAIGFMGAFFSSFLTRKRICNGQLTINEKTESASWLPVHPAIRALLFALLGAVVTLNFFALLTFGFSIDSRAFI